MISFQDLHYVISNSELPLYSEAGRDKFDLLLKFSLSLSEWGPTWSGWWARRGCVPRPPSGLQSPGWSSGGAHWGPWTNCSPRHRRHTRQGSSWRWNRQHCLLGRESGRHVIRMTWNDIFTLLVHFLITYAITIYSLRRQCILQRIQTQLGQRKS